jgi:hypothetical protein
MSISSWVPKMSSKYDFKSGGCALQNVFISLMVIDYLNYQKFEDYKSNHSSQQQSLLEKLEK